MFAALEDLRSWADRLEEVQERLAPYLERALPRQRAKVYRRGEFAQHRAQERVEAPQNWREKPRRTAGSGC